MHKHSFSRTLDGRDATRDLLWGHVVANGFLLVWPTRFEKQCFLSRDKMLFARFAFTRHEAGQKMTSIFNVAYVHCSCRLYPLQHGFMSHSLRVYRLTCYPSNMCSIPWHEGFTAPSICRRERSVIKPKQRRPLSPRTLHGGGLAIVYWRVITV